MLRPMSSARSRGGMEEYVFPGKTVVPQERKKLSWGDTKMSPPPPPPPPRHKYRKKLNGFCINITTREQFFISVSKSTKNYVKAAVA